MPQDSLSRASVGFRSKKRKATKPKKGAWISWLRLWERAVAMQPAENYPKSSLIGLPVVMGRRMPVLFCGSFKGMSRAW